MKPNKRNLKHGMTKTRIHYSWKAMKKRCFNLNCKDYKNYGGRGIAVCNRWLGKNGFQNFYCDMGEMPENKTLDRIKNNKGYYKENCCWSTKVKQQNNRRNNIFITYQNKIQTVAQWARELKTSDSTLRSRLRKTGNLI